MKTLLKLTASCLAVLVLGSAGVQAQQARMGEAVHRGTYNFLRSGPDQHAPIIEKMRQETRFEVVGLQNGYYAVILADGTRGWTAHVNVRFL